MPQMQRLPAATRLLLVLTATFVTCLVVGDIIGGKLIQTTPLGQVITLTVGMIPFPVTFLLTDLLNEFYGQRTARFVTLLGLAMAVLAYAVIWLAGAIPIAPIALEPGWAGVTEPAFDNVFMGSRRMIVASLCAYVVAQFVDIFVFHALRRATQTRLLWLRATGSTVVSQLIDTVVINLVAWLGILRWEQIVNIAVSSYFVKVAIALGLTPLVYLGHALIARALGIGPSSLDPEGVLGTSESASH